MFEEYRNQYLYENDVVTFNTDYQRGVGVVLRTKDVAGTCMIIVKTLKVLSNLDDIQMVPGYEKTLLQEDVKEFFQG